MDGIYALALIALTAAIGIPLGVSSARKPRQRAEKAQAAAPVYFDLSDVGVLPDAREVAGALRGRTSVWHVGKRARVVIEQLDEVSSAQERLLAIIDSKFEPGSLTNAKFRAPVEEACKALVRNAAAFSNRVQEFDGRELTRMRKVMGDGSYRLDDIPDGIQEARWSAISSEYSSIKDLVNANKLILAELSKLEKELLALSSCDMTADSGQLADELDELSTHARLYH